MSADRVRAGRGKRALTLLLVVAALVVGFGLWAFVPRDLGVVRVEGVRLLQAGVSDGGNKPDYLATPVRIAVIFAVPRDLEAVRDELGMGYVAAQLAACGSDGEANAQEVVTQRAGYLGDYGRVRRIGATPEGGVRYRAVFDDALTATIDNQAQRTPALAASGGLCLSLYGSRMWFGRATSEAVPIGTPAA